MSKNSEKSKNELLTICTVSFESKRFLKLNWELSSLLNCEQKLTWLVAENSPSCSNDSLKLDDSNFDVIPGANYETKVWASASYHHAAAMNKILPQIKTRYALFLDPDFYIIRKSWIKDILDHMEANDLSFFGAPWHPKYYIKDRYFPCVHCLFIDLKKVPLNSLDFSPVYSEVPAYASSDSLECGKEILQKLSKKLTYFSSSSLKRIDFLEIRKRIYIGASKDVSYLISEKYKNDKKHKNECLVPSFESDLPARKMLIEKLLPDHLCFIPKRKGYFTRQKFNDCGFADLDSYGWEEFFWNGSPFGFHVRCYPKRVNGKILGDVFEPLNSILDQVLSLKDSTSKSFKI
jgi:hypothetical protein